MNRNFSILAASAAALAFFAVAFPASAARVLAVVECMSTSSCAGDLNKGTGPGIEGVSEKGNGVSGVTKNNTWAIKAGGVIGSDVSTEGFGNAGVKGVSTVATGVRGESRDGFGVDGLSLFSNGVVGTTVASNQGQARYGILGLDGANKGSINAGVRGQSIHSVGVQGEGPTALEGVSNGTILTGLNQSSGKTVFRVDGKGDVFAAAFKTQLQTSSGPSVVTYSNQSSTPSLEDFGEESLVNGQGYVRFDGRLASAMQRGARYLVFITPQGPTRGALYVTQKTPAGFVVRENAPGRSSVAFDYRVVVQPLGATAERFPLAPQAPNAP
jgi:hypothetical protein